MSSTMKFTSLAPLLISCTLPLASVAQPPAGSFREGAATTFYFQQLCPPDFPMPDIWKRQCAGQIDSPAFAPVWLPSCFGWNRPLIYGPVPAENVSWQLQNLVEAPPRTHRTSSSGSCRPAAPPPITSFESGLSRLMGTHATATSKKAVDLTTAENHQQSKPIFA